MIPNSNIKNKATGTWGHCSSGL